ncbi:Ankycorbin [Diplogelasinospora grovesii]|uniref:Ankycorbin n=1 Tax=Diplogelasinospora grovesii TaxID=303347 RepID=A0AAN6N114_9PEZI|nr:Ankycorbin [Diplogelasinospora grovesii]
MMPNTFPKLPVPHSDLVKYIAEHPDTPMVDLIEPYRQYEHALRQTYAQAPDDERIKDPLVNVLPLFTDGTCDIKIRARNLANESEEEKARYIMALPKDQRRADGSQAIVPALKEFRRNFNVFSESSLVELNWDNVVASGSSVVNCLLPVPNKFNSSKRGLREFYHEKFCPASDVDLFLYGLTEEQAIEKIKDIETRVRDALLTETTVVRTKHAITICSQYPTRHIQIVLRLYKSVSEILTGFDIDCSGAAYDGNQVYVTPRALQSFVTQINHVDLSRRSPSYENRLSKYSHRGFEVHWPDLDRSRVDPTIFERSFQRTLGLARLLVLERLPTQSARESYLDKRREERGRPAINRWNRRMHTLSGNIKDSHEDEVADWVNEEEVSNYHTFTVPYGPKFHAKKIEKLCYTRDLLLNAEWNQPKDREVYLHRHPAFFGRFEDVTHDCCGYCPVPQTDDEKEIAEEEAKTYVSGNLTFMKDDPGRQQIGSFNPLTDDDWTEMAYVGNTARLCQAIVDGDVEHVEDWLAQEEANPDTRDYTGRTPLHLAVMSSTPEVVRRLVDAGARLVSRLADGRTALHLAAQRGNVEILKILMEQSISNEAEYEEKMDQRRKAKAASREPTSDVDQDKNKDEDMEDDDKEEDESDGEMIGDEESDEDGHSMATGSFVKVGGENDAAKETDTLPEEDEDEPDFYDVNIIAWDTPCSALHLAIVEGHEEVVKALCEEYGADVLLPIKFLDQQKKPEAALLTLVLALALPVEKAKSMAKTLLNLGATSAQADLKGCTALYRYVEKNAESLLDTLLEMDKTGTKTAINHIVFDYYSSKTPLDLAVSSGNLSLVLKLLDNGAMPQVDFETWLKAARQSVIENRLSTFEDNKRMFNTTKAQPLILALQSSDPRSALELLERGADPNALPISTYQGMGRTWYSSRDNASQSALDIVTQQLETLRDYTGEKGGAQKPRLPKGIEEYLKDFAEGTYQRWVVAHDINKRQKTHRKEMKAYKKEEARLRTAPGIPEKMDAVKEAIAVLEKIEQALLAKGAKPFSELHPDEAKMRNANPNTLGGNVTPNADKVEPYKYNFTFRLVTDVTEVRKTAYLELFEAAWSGDLGKIKTLTLTCWDEDKQEAPLKIAVRDDDSNNPFSLAFFRGHYNVAKAILEIAQAQYSPEEQVKTRYTMEQGEYSDDESVCSDGSEPRIYAEIVDDQFTIENVGQVSMKVNSRTKPQEMLNWFCTVLSSDGKRGGMGNVFGHVIQNNDMKGLKFLLDMGEYFTSQKLDGEDEVARFYSFPDAHFKDAIQKGRTELLAEIIKRTGAGLPLEQLVKDSGVELKEKPRFYQGLTVYGKKRKDWATKGRNIIKGPSNGTQTSPLLTAAMASCIESVEWFLSDIPLRHYLDFAKSKAARDDTRLKHLSQSSGGVDKAISKWLNGQSELVIHAAMLAPIEKRAETASLVRYLVKACPESTVNTKAGNGMTPLMLACRLGRVDIAEILIQSAGADQITRDGNGNNLLHAALHKNPTASQLKPLLDLLDPDVLVSLLKERNRPTVGGMTPIHHWLRNLAYSQGPPYKSEGEEVDLLKLLFSLAPQDVMVKALNMFDGAGDSILHMLIARVSYGRTYNDLSLVRTLLEFCPDLLYRENAVGRTPAEVAHDRFIASKMAAPETRWNYSYHNNGNNNWAKMLTTAEPNTFVEKQEDEKEKEKEKEEPKAAIWRLCLTYMGAEDGLMKRTLVSLQEANDVSKRLHQGISNIEHDRYGFKLSSSGSSDKGNEEEGAESVRHHPDKDILTRMIDEYGQTWPREEEEEEVKKEDGSEEVNPPEVCSCGRVHKDLAAPFYCPGKRLGL